MVPRMNRHCAAWKVSVQIAHRLQLLIGHPHRPQLPPPMQPRQHQRITPVRLHLLPTATGARPSGPGPAALPVPEDPGSFGNGQCGNRAASRPPDCRRGGQRCRSPPPDNERGAGMDWLAPSERDLVNRLHATPSCFVITWCALEGPRLAGSTIVLPFGAGCRSGRHVPCRSRSLLRWRTGLFSS